MIYCICFLKGKEIIQTMKFESKEYRDSAFSLFESKNVNGIKVKKITI